MNVALTEDQSRYINREISWLQFNRRVLMEAENTRNPLLERLRFLSISADNLNEFLMVRIAGLAGQVRENVSTLSDNGQTPDEQLNNATREIARLQARQLELFRALKAEMSDSGLDLLKSGELTKEERSWAEDHFLSHIFPVLTPLCIDPAHPFPFMPNLGLTLVLDLERRKDGKPMTALLRLPQPLKRFVALPQPKIRDDGTPKAPSRFISVEEVIGLFIDRLFPGYDMRQSGMFRLVRDSDIEVQEEAEDLVRLFESALKQLRR